ncbi:hypothetical protein J6590_039108 [Homalodisca vitripennis]|nr:hypothetical protein J6590_039108 [Homalodisca vitripennis]
MYKFENVKQSVSDCSAVRGMENGGFNIDGYNRGGGDCGIIFEYRRIPTSSSPGLLCLRIPGVIGVGSAGSKLDYSLANVHNVVWLLTSPARFAVTMGFTVVNRLRPNGIPDNGNLLGLQGGFVPTLGEN